MATMLQSLKKLTKLAGSRFSNREIRTLDGFNDWDMLREALLKETVLLGVVDQVKGDMETGDLVLYINSIQGIIPHDEIGEYIPPRLTGFIGREVAFKVTLLDREKDTVYLSCKAAWEAKAPETLQELRESSAELIKVRKEINTIRPANAEEITPELRQQMKELITKAKEVGPTVTGVIINVQENLALVDIGFVMATLPVTEISWSYVKDARELLHEDMCFNFKVYSIDFDKKRVRVSLKATMKDPWTTYVEERYVKEAMCRGKVIGFTKKNNLVIELEPGINAFCGKNENQEYEIGAGVKVRLGMVDIVKHFIGGHVVGPIVWDTNDYR